MSILGGAAARREASASSVIYELRLFFLGNMSKREGSVALLIPVIIATPTRFPEILSERRRY